MKIQCGVCEKMEASVFCAADEAALCHGCDSSIHHANKLASKHMRFSLHHPTSKDSPLCDICQEKRAYLFCKEDRAILCRECDLNIHRANEHTQKHNRFLLTGVKLSDSSAGDPSSSSCNAITTENKRVDNGSREARRSCRNSNTNRPIWDCNENFSSSNSVLNSDTMVSDTEAVSTSSFSEYLIETIPGFCFEDLIDASFPPLMSMKMMLHFMMNMKKMFKLECVYIQNKTQQRKSGNGSTMASANLSTVSLKFY